MRTGSSLDCKKPYQGETPRGHRHGDWLIPSLCGSGFLGLSKALEGSMTEASAEALQPHEGSGVRKDVRQTEKDQRLEGENPTSGTGTK